MEEGVATGSRAQAEEDREREEQEVLRKLDSLTFNPQTKELSVYFVGVKCMDCDTEVICGKHTPVIKRILYPTFVEALEMAKGMEDVGDGLMRDRKLMPFIYGMVATHIRPYRGNKRLSLAMINGMVHHTGQSAEDVYDSIQEMYEIQEGPMDEERECALNKVMMKAMRGKEGDGEDA